MSGDAMNYPLPHLSVSSLGVYLRCPELWRRTRLEGQRTPATSNMLVGAAAGAAEREHFHRSIDGQPLTADDVLDRYSDEFELGAERDTVEWLDPRGKVKDSGAAALRTYHEVVTPQLVPITAERRFELRFGDAPWALIGYLDAETLPGQLEPGQLPPPPGEVRGTTIEDLKFSGKRWTRPVGPKPAKGEPDTRRRVASDDSVRDLQPRIYGAARRAEGDPAPRFRFNVAVRYATPIVELIELQLPDVALDDALRRVWDAAGEIAWRIENDRWHGAPQNAWWCSSTACPFWTDCRFGGRTAAIAAATVRTNGGNG